MKNKISIIIPVYNIGKELEKTLNSLIKQTIGIEKLEIIIVNDCSTDDTADIIKKYTDKYDNFIEITLHQNSGLPGKPRNIGLRTATSEFIMFMDHDDCYAEDAMETLYNKITEENADMVFCNFKFVFDDGAAKNISTYKNKPEIKIETIENDTDFLALSPSIWTKMFRRSFILENNILFPEGILAEDLSFFINSLLKANGIIFLNNYYGYYYRIRNTELDKSTIHIRNKKYLYAMILGYIDTYNILIQNKKDKYFPVIFNGHLEYWMKCFVMGDITRSEKIELLNEVAFLFKKLSKFSFNMNESYLLLFNKIKNDEFNDAILISEVSSVFIKKELYLQNQQLKLQKANQDLKKDNQDLKKDNQDLKKVNHSYNDKIQKMETSNSWKLTKPLRIVVSSIKK